jgi:hypothetical protein
LLLLVGGCLKLPNSGPPPECDVTADCEPGTSEVCDEGLCWGNPPPGQFAVVISPPSTRSDLIATELTAVDISADGWLDPIASAWPISLHGRIEAACEDCRVGSSIAATITVRRPSVIPGAPAFLASTSSDPDAPSADSFAVWVPAPGADDPPFQITIQPSESEPIFPGGPTPAEVVPPLRISLSGADLAVGLDVLLSADQIRTVHGQILNQQNEGASGRKVFARGRVDPMLPLERVSTIATTNSNGDFTLLLGTDALDVIDVIVEPPQGAIAPTLIAADRYASSTEPLVIHLPPPAGPTHVSIPVVHVDTNGSDAPVATAKVEMFTTITLPDDPQVTAVFSVSGQTDDLGHFEADVIAGSASTPRTYSVRIVPPPEAITASKLSTVEVGPDGGTLATVRLDQRSSVNGVIVDAGGTPVDSVTVKAMPSLFFLWSLDEDTQELLTSRGRPETITNLDGTFTVWLDPSISGVPMTYDLAVEPADFSAVPRATVAGIDATVSQDLESIFLPESAYVRGVVTDPSGNPLADAQVKIYEIAAEEGACIAQHAPQDCQPPAIIRATGRTDESGIVRLTLPR